jgi:FixJ family two-component response regulator
MEVIKRISWGESIKEMANAMYISKVTINRHQKAGSAKSDTGCCGNVSERDDFLNLKLHIYNVMK